MSVLELSYQLPSLSSAQHRAGLAGLVLMVQYLQQQPEFSKCKGAIAELTALTPSGATLRLSLKGLKALFNLTYAALWQERWSDKKIKRFDRVETITSKDPNGKPESRQRYYYSVIAPQGAFINDWETSSGKIWLHLWRTMYVQVIREIDRKRIPLQRRLSGAYTKDAERLWKDLQHPETAVKLSSTYYLGAMARSPDNVPFLERAHLLLLLHFWPFATQVYCPVIQDSEGSVRQEGYVLAIPDLRDLSKFCQLYPQLLLSRETKCWGHSKLPRAAIIVLPEEAAMNQLLLLQKQAARKFGNQSIAQTVCAIEVIHAVRANSKRGVTFRSISRVEAAPEKIERYAVAQASYKCFWFYRQRLLNILHNRPAWSGFDCLDLPCWL